MADESRIERAKEEWEWRKITRPPSVLWKTSTPATPTFTVIDDLEERTPLSEDGAPSAEQTKKDINEAFGEMFREVLQEVLYEDLAALKSHVLDTSLKVNAIQEEVDKLREEMPFIDKSLYDIHHVIDGILDHIKNEDKGEPDETK